MSKKLKILAASDIHGDSKLVRKLAEKAEKEDVDLVVLCGDIVGWSETKDIIKPFKDKNKRVLILPGNWDNFATADFVAGPKNCVSFPGDPAPLVATTVSESEFKNC